jgi:hypothetical protein
LFFIRKLDRFTNRARPIKQANPKVLDYISQTMAYYPNGLSLPIKNNK